MNECDHGKTYITRHARRRRRRNRASERGHGQKRARSNKFALRPARPSPGLPLSLPPSRSHSPRGRRSPSSCIFPKGQRTTKPQDWIPCITLYVCLSVGRSVDVRPSSSVLTFLLSFLVGRSSPSSFENVFCGGGGGDDGDNSYNRFSTSQSIRAPSAAASSYTATVAPQTQSALERERVIDVLRR